MRRLIVVLLVAATCSVVAEPAHAGGKPLCRKNIGITDAATTCIISGDETAAAVATSTTNGRVVEVRDACGLGGGGVNVCYETATCTEDGEPGTLVDVYVDGEFVGKSCLTPGAAEQLAVITPGLVLREFQRLTWPDSPLKMQPVGRKTAVNLETFFFTDNTHPHTQTVTLLGQRVTIEATPAEYVYHFETDQSARTTSPGGPYPSGEVTHTYRHEGRAAPSVDTVYVGRYRVNNGRWIDIPAPLTVRGEQVGLRIVAYRPTLVTPPTT